MAIPADAPQSPSATDTSTATSNIAPADSAVTTTASTNYTASTRLPPLAPPAPAPEVRLSPSATEIAKLAQAGLGDDVMLAHVANMTSSFNLGSDQILYLNDLGVSGSVVKAMIQRDAALQAASANSLAALTPPATNSNLPTPDDSGPALPAATNGQLQARPLHRTTPAITRTRRCPNLIIFTTHWHLTGVGLMSAAWAFAGSQPFCLINHDWRSRDTRSASRWLNSDCG